MINKRFSVFFTVLIVTIFFNGVSNRETVNIDDFFIQDIWQQILQTGILDKILATNFIQGIKSGKLNPWCFSKYIVQDLEYMNQTVKLWDRACRDGERDIQFSRFCKPFNASVHEYYGWMKKQLSVSSIQTFDVVSQYIKDELKIYSRNSYHYIVVVYYACMKVYNELGSRLISVANHQSAYFDWIRQNQEYQEYKTFQKIINYYQTFFDRQQVKNDLLKLIDYQFLLFHASCQQNYLSQSKILKIQ